jgi:hypothetical protein
MEWFLVPIAALVALVLAVPPIALGVIFVMLVVRGLFGPAAHTVARQTIDCPFSRRRARLEVEGAEDSERPLDVLSCSVFDDPRQVRCKKGCLELVSMGVVATPLMPRFALVDGGVAYRLQTNGAEPASKS